MFRPIALRFSHPDDSAESGTGASTVAPISRKLPPSLFICVHLWFLILFTPAPASAGAWTLPQGSLWTKLTFLSQDTNEDYIGVPRPNIPRGSRQPYLLDGEYSARTFFFDAMYGVTDRFTVGVQIPFFHQSFEDIELATLFGGAATSTGFSDIRFFAKHAVTTGPIVSALKVGVKAPTGEFENKQGLIPVGEGQWDVDFIAQVGRSFWPIPLYANVDLGYRIRRKNAEIDRDPGDEFFWIAEIGYSWTDRLMTVLKWEGLDGSETTSLGLTLSGDVKKIQYISPSLLLRLTDEISAEAGTRFSIRGQNYPAGPVYQFALTYSK